MSARLRQRVSSASQPAEDFEFLESYPFHSDGQLKPILKKCVSYIRICKEPALVLVDVKAKNALTTLACNARDPENKEIFEDTDFIEIISNTLVAYKKNLKALVNSNTVGLGETGFDNLMLRQLACFKLILSISHSVSNSSKSFRQKFFDFKGTKALLDYLDDDELVLKLQKFNGLSIDSMVNRPLLTDLSGLDLIQCIIGSLNTLSLVALSQRFQFEEIQAKRIILKFIKFLNDSKITSSLIKTLAEMTLVNIVSDDDIENVPDAKNALLSLVTILKSLGETLKDDKSIQRDKIDFEIDDDSSQEISFEKVEVVRHNCGWNLAEIISSIYRLAINDKFKKELFNTHQVRDVLFVFIQIGNDWEKMFALKLLWQLCFDKDIAKKVRDDNELYELITKLNAENSNKYVKKYGQGIVWSIEKLNEMNKNKDFNSKKNHIMISYNRNSRPLCFKIKAELERLGHSVWIDVENIHGSTLEAMANAIEESKCVLICMTEDYKQSVYCRAV